jgi:hypothetical protein
MIGSVNYCVVQELCPDGVVTCLHFQLLQTKVPKMSSNVGDKTEQPLTDCIMHSNGSIWEELQLWHEVYIKISVFLALQLFDSLQHYSRKFSQFFPSVCTPKHDTIFECNMMFNVGMEVSLTLKMKKMNYGWKVYAEKNIWTKRR